MGRTSTKRGEILSYIRQFTAENSYPPSVREIMEAVGLRSTASVHYHLSALQEEGALSMEGSKSRTISLPEQRGIPIVGVVTAGVPILAVENIEGYLSTEEEGCFALRVRGDSMINAGILNGDLVVVSPQSTADHRDIVVALLEDSATVKRLSKQGAEVWLLPENPAYEPIDGRNARILGKVRRVVREY